MGSGYPLGGLKSLSRFYAEAQFLIKVRRLVVLDEALVGSGPSGAAEIALSG